MPSIVARVASLGIVPGRAYRALIRRLSLRGLGLRRQHVAGFAEEECVSRGTPGLGGDVAGYVSRGTGWGGGLRVAPSRSAHAPDHTRPITRARMNLQSTRPILGGRPHLSFSLWLPPGCSDLTIPFAALAALLAALLETSVLSEMPIAGATVDLVLVCAVAAALALGVMDGLVAAFLGGLLVDLLVPARPLGAATFALLLVAGIAAASSSALGSNRRLAAMGLAFVLTIVYEVVLALVLVLTENAPLALAPEGIFAAAVMSAVLIVPVVAVFGLLERRFGAAERSPW